MPMLMMLSREVRRVPLDYKPPRGERGWQPRFDQFYAVALAEWTEAKARWDAGERPDFAGRADCTFEEYEGDAPDPAYYYPGAAWPTGTVLGIQMYETVTEGTPISAVHPDTPEGRESMARELAFHGGGGIADDLTVDDWHGIIDGQVMAKDIHTGEIV